MPADDYAPPVDDILATLDHVGLDDILALPAHAHLTRADVRDVVAEFGRFAAEVLAPTNRIGDREGARFDPATGQVTVPDALAKAFRRYVEGGWGTLTAPLDEGGVGLPGVVGLAVGELFASANVALSLNPTLTHGAVDLLRRWGTDAQRATYLPRLVTGEWTGTMDLTEPDAGSDVGAVRTRAVPTGDGRWSVTGTKVFITWGEHDLAENIVHLVLARTPGAPPGTRGVSLFLVPRHLVDDRGAIGARNAVRCLGVEHKLGIHASPTCTIELDGAVGELVAGEHQGMAAMFTMMNAARLNIGLQGLAVAERAHQQALAHARQRVQGRPVGAPAGTPILAHPDVTRLLLSTATSVDAMRHLLYATAAAGDLARHHPDPDRRAAAAARADLLTPLAKAWPTDEGVRVASRALQVQGGMGYVEETGAAQHLRDARIGPIYEGTNGIQAIDLVGRKVRRDDGAALAALVADLDAVAERLAASATLGDLAPDLAVAVEALRVATADLLAVEDPRAWLAGASPYLSLAALVVAAGSLADQALATGAPRDAGRLRYFVADRLVAAPALARTATAGPSILDPALLA